MHEMMFKAARMIKHAALFPGLWGRNEAVLAVFERHYTHLRGN